MSLEILGKLPRKQQALLSTFKTDSYSQILEFSRENFISIRKRKLNISFKMELTCNNRGCGKRYNPRDNPPDSKACVFHPGAPYFHDAYKGWSCCGKKCTDFTEFLNVPGTNFK